MVNDASTGSTPGEEPPVSWAAATSIEGGEPKDRSPSERRLGFPAADLDGLIALADDVEALATAVGAAAGPFLGAYVPVVVHDTASAERSYDAAEWAADLISSGGGTVLAVATYAEPDWDGERLNARQWNHAAAMIERLDGVCQRFRLRIAVHETVGGDDLAAGGPDDAPLRHLLDTGRYVDDGFVPVQLVCPERLDAEIGLIDRVKGMLRDRT